MFNLFKNLKGKNKELSNQEFLKKLWNNKNFKSGKQCFRYANLGFFNFCDKGCYSKNQLEEKMTLAVHDFNGDREIYGKIYSKKGSEFIYYQSWDNEPIHIADSLNHMFDSGNITSKLVNRENEEYWAWEESCHHNYEINKNIPECVFPNEDLRTYLSNKYNLYISDHKEFNKEELAIYLNDINVKLYEIIPNDFNVFDPNDERLEKLIRQLNNICKSEKLHILKFNPSNFWGLVSEKHIDKKGLEEIKKLGL